MSERGGGHSSYVRTHARAACLAGFHPEILCVGKTEDLRESDFGSVHRFESPLSFVPQRRGIAYRSPMDPIHIPFLIERAAKLLEHWSKTPLLHGFGSYGIAAVGIRDRLKLKERDSRCIVSVYTTIEHERTAKYRGCLWSEGITSKLTALLELWWTRLTMLQREKDMLERSDLLLVNYGSVEKLIKSITESPGNIRRSSYSTESAFIRKPRAERTELSRAGAEILESFRAREGPLLLSISRHDSRKGLDLFLKALARLKSRSINFRALLLGGGSLLRKHKQLASRLGLDESTVIAGFVENATELLERADLFILPSIEEGSGSLSLIEALEAGIAVVASAVDGIPEDVEHGRSALLVKPNCHRSLAEAMERLIINPREREEIAQGARDAFLKKFAPSLMVESLKKTYEELLLRFPENP